MLHVIFSISLADADSITEFTLKSLSIIMVNLFFPLGNWEKRMVPFRILLTAIVFQYHFTLLILLYHDNCATNIKGILTKSKCEQGINMQEILILFYFIFCCWDNSYWHAHAHNTVTWTYPLCSRCPLVWLGLGDSSKRRKKL